MLTRTQPQRSDFLACPLLPPRVLCPTVYLPVSPGGSGRTLTAHVLSGLSALGTGLRRLLSLSSSHSRWVTHAQVTASEWALGPLLTSAAGNQGSEMLLCRLWEVLAPTSLVTLGRDCRTLFQHSHVLHIFTPKARCLRLAMPTRCAARFSPEPTSALLGCGAAPC